MRYKSRRLIALLALALLVSACKSGAAKGTGEAIFNQRCRDCHRVNDEGGVVGPDLSRVGARRSRTFLDQMVRNPSRLFPGATMPPYDALPADQLKLLVDYLVTLK